VRTSSSAVISLLMSLREGSGSCLSCNTLLYPGGVFGFLLNAATAVPTLDRRWAQCIPRRRSLHTYVWKKTGRFQGHVTHLTKETRHPTGLQLQVFDRSALCQRPAHVHASLRSGFRPGFRLDRLIESGLYLRKTSHINRSIYFISGNKAHRNNTNTHKYRKEKKDRIKRNMVKTRRGISATADLLACPSEHFVYHVNWRYWGSLRLASLPWAVVTQ